MILGVRQHPSAEALVSPARNCLGRLAYVPAHPSAKPWRRIADGDPGGSAGRSVVLDREPSDDEALPHVMSFPHRLRGEESGDSGHGRSPNNTLRVVPAGDRGGSDFPTDQIREGLDASVPFLAQLTFR